MKLMRAIQDSWLPGAVVLLLGACGGAGVGITAAAVTDAALAGNTTLTASAQQAGVQCAPPPEAVAACVSHAKDDACKIALPDRTLDGTCALLADGSLACRPERPPRPPPPPEATAACASHAAGDTCSFTHEDHTVSGTCKADEHAGAGSALACAPEHKGPPPEAIAACSGLASGATCAFKLGDHDLTGTCLTGPDNAALSCAPPCPQGPPPGPPGPPGPHGPPPPEALAACATHAAGDACSFTHDNHNISGTCKADEHAGAGSALACAPDHGGRPPPPHP